MQRYNDLRTSLNPCNNVPFFRVDWNLVSTASTAINAWLNPIDQLTISIVAMLKGYSKRSSGLLASLMAEALDCQSIHQPMRVSNIITK
jgi:hypothetical protein